MFMCAGVDGGNARSASEPRVFYSKTGIHVYRMIILPQNGCEGCPDGAGVSRWIGEMCVSNRQWADRVAIKFDGVSPCEGEECHPNTEMTKKKYEDWDSNPGPIG